MDSKLTTADWRKIRMEYVKGKTTYRQLAEKYGIGESTIRKRASKEGWRKKRNDLDTKVEQKALERVCDARAKEFELIAQVNDRMDDVLDHLLDFIGKQPAQKYDDLRGVESLTKAIAQVVETKRNLYNIPSEIEKANIAAKNEMNKLNRQRFNFERKKYRDEQAEKAAMKQAIESTMIKVVVEGSEDGEPLDE